VKKKLAALGDVVEMRTERDRLREQVVSD